jgi:PPK2 family polyphosphate:nucleotide phosphotransferase
MNSSPHLDHAPFLVPPDTSVRLKDFDPGFTSDFKNKNDAKAALLEDVSALADAQQLLWASAEYSVLIIFQAMDAAGKDGAIRHVMSGVNPQGVEVRSFKAPTDEERLHHFLWRPARVLPARGRIAIFNRSYYEEVLVVRVHPQWLEQQWLPRDVRDKDLKLLWQRRYEEINIFEKIAVHNGICVIKFFLHVSKSEQKKRFLERLDNPEKNWKFSAADVRERQYWNDYMQAYEEMLSATSTRSAPWYIVPADKKWFTRSVVADIIAARIGQLDLEYPKPGPEHQSDMAAAKRELEEEG